MRELQRRRQRDLLLTTLIDLLVQILFLLLVAIVIVSPKQEVRSIVSQAKKLMDETGKSLPQITEIWRRLVDPDTLDRRYRELQGQRDTLSLRNEEIENRLKSFEERFNALGDKPCWMTPNLQPEILFLVRIFDEGVELIPRWSSRRETEAQALKIPLRSMERRISLVEFSDALRPVFQASKQEDCRHYVDLEIHATSGAKATDNRGMVEGYFYVRAVKRPRR